jgi:hypothetical protein
MTTSMHDDPRFVVQSLDDLSTDLWQDMARRLIGYARMLLKGRAMQVEESGQLVLLGPQEIAARAVLSLRDGRRVWDRAVCPNLLSWLFNVVRSICAATKASAIGTIEMDTKTPGQKRKRRRGSSRMNREANVATIVDNLSLGEVAVLMRKLDQMLSIRSVAKPVEMPRFAIAPTEGFGIG